MGGAGDVLLEVSDLKVHFSAGHGLGSGNPGSVVKAVDGVSFSLRRGETLGLVGESGCGKSTLALSILRLQQPTDGRVIFQGRDLAQMGPRHLRRVRRDMQMVFQDPYSSLNPRMTAGQAIAEPLVVHRLASGAALRKRVAELLDTVGLRPEMADRYPHQFSGGQRQRIGIARALAVQPSLVVCDEAVSALDVSVQAQVLNLLQELQDRFDLTYIFITHDLSVVHHIADRIAVMYLGHIVELADRHELFENPLHPYTRALFSSLPIPDPEVEAAREEVEVAGEVPSPLNRPVGCVFHPRCPIAIEDCRVAMPELRELTPGHWVACIRAGIELLPAWPMTAGQMPGVS